MTDPTSRRLPRGILLSLLLYLGGSCSFAQAPAQPGDSWQYRLLEGSYLLDDCLICGRPTFFIPMRGTFTLRLVAENPLTAQYALEEIAFAAGDDYRVTGSGEYEIGGEVAVVQKLKLRVEIKTAGGVDDAFFGPDSQVPSRRWPMLSGETVQTNGTFVHTYTLTLAAAPLRDLWFSTRAGLTSARDPKHPLEVSDGDLLSMSGNVVRTQLQLRQASGVDSRIPDLGLDSATALPGGRIGFSTRDSTDDLRDGDWVDDTGQVLARFEDLLAPFTPMPPIPPVGLKTVYPLESGETWFSIREDLFSEGLSRTLHHGDVLSSNGTVARDHADLLAQFHPPARKGDYGLGCLFVWPGGEIWFSVEEGFQDENLGQIVPGDLLSDTGYIVYRNLELVRIFAPMQDLADFGLDAVSILSDFNLTTPPPLPPIITSLQQLPFHDGLTLFWQGKGRAFQVLRAGNPTGPYVPVTPLVPGQSVDLPDALSGMSSFFLRLEQW